MTSFFFGSVSHRYGHVGGQPNYILYGYANEQANESLAHYIQVTKQNVNPAEE